MKLERIIEAMRRGGSIPENVVEELHQLVREHGSHDAKAAISAWKYGLNGLAPSQTTDEEQYCKIDDSILEGMYRHYISANRRPFLTFREYTAIVETLTGLRAA